MTSTRCAQTVPVTDLEKLMRDPAVSFIHLNGILHNGFRDQVNNQSLASLVTVREIENTLNMSMPGLVATSKGDLISAADNMAAVATSIPESLRVAGLIATDALDIPVNKPPGVTKAARLLYAGRPGKRFSLGSMSFTLLGPTSKELSDLRKGWNHWLDKNAKQVNAIVFDSRADDDDPFEFWFSTTSKAQAGLPNQAHFREVEKRARALRKRSKGRLTLHFNEGAGVVLPI